MKHLFHIGWVLMLAVACRSGHESPQKPVISVTILPQEFYVEKLAGSLLETNVMVPSGASPATYEPTVRQLRKLENSPLYLKIGWVEFELGWMEKIAASNPSMKITDLSEGIDLLPGEQTGKVRDGNDHDENEHVGNEHVGHDHSGADPHVWMSARNARILAQNTCDALVSQWPKHTDVFNRNLDQLLQEIDSVDKAISALLEPYRDGAFMIYHPALTYFARDYHLAQYPLEFGGKEPSPMHMKQMVDLGKEKHISAIFIQKQFDQRNASVLAGEIGARVIQIDPLEADWSSEMLHIAKQLKLSFE